MEESGRTPRRADEVGPSASLRLAPQGDGVRRIARARRAKGNVRRWWPFAAAAVPDRRDPAELQHDAGGLDHGPVEDASADAGVGAVKGGAYRRVQAERHEDGQGEEGPGGEYGRDDEVGRRVDAWVSERVGDEEGGQGGLGEQGRERRDVSCGKQVYGRERAEQDLDGGLAGGCVAGEAAQGTHQ